MKTFKLYLEPDERFPEFRRLRWEVVEVSLEDVLLHGVHPWCGPDAHFSLPGEFLRRLNTPEQALPELEPFGYCHEFQIGPGQPGTCPSRFEWMLHELREKVRFVEDLAYLELLEIARRRLRERWGHPLALSMLGQLFYAFPEQRAFLKTKDKSLKLRGYGDLDHYDLGRVLSPEDFERHEGLIITKTVSPLNFRRASFLREVADEQGRLRLIPEIRDFALCMKPKPPAYGSSLFWKVRRDGTCFRFYPDLGDSGARRQRAREFASQWRTGGGRYCFESSLEKVMEMVRRDVASPAFPTLDYRHGGESQPPGATAIVAASRVQAYHVGAWPRSKLPADNLKQILRHYGVSMTGNKDAMTRKLAKLAADVYREHEPGLDAYFRAHRFIRTQQPPAYPREFPMLQDVPHLRSLLIALYLLTHLRGNAIVDPDHENDAYTKEEAAHALITGRTALSGAFLPAV